MTSAIAIVGAGAMGSAFAYLFCRTDHRVVLLEKNEHVAAALFDGLVVHDGDHRITCHPAVGILPDSIRGADPVFIFVKGYSTETAMSEIAGAVGASTVVSLQNGIGNKEIIAKCVGDDAIVYGSIVLGATKIAPNEVSLRGGGDVVIGGSNAKRLEAVRALLAQAGLAVSVTDDPDRTVWEKAIANAAINPLGALLGIPNGLIASNPHSARVQEAVVREAVSVARAAGVPVDADAMIASVRDICLKTESNHCSMLQDVAAGRASEIDVINGAIVRYGSEHGIATPWNEALCLLVKAKERNHALYENYMP